MSGSRHGRGGDLPDVISRYLAECDRHLAVPRRYRRQVLSEAADHLREAAEAEKGRRGADASAAEAVRRFGPANRFAAEINAGWASARVRRAPAFAALAGVGVMAAAVAGIPTTPTAARPDGAAAVSALSTVALLALQLAVVAGAVALLRVLARRSAPVLGAADRALAWRAARLCVASTAVAGAGFLGVAALQAHRTGSGPGRVVAVALAMLAVLAVATSALRCPRPAECSDLGDPAAGASSPSTTGKAWRRAGRIERLARAAEQARTIAWASPGPVTALVAGLAAATFYAHAETSRSGSLLAAAAEATAVVVFARIFGPALELRAAPPADDRIRRRL